MVKLDTIYARRSDGAQVYICGIIDDYVHYCFVHFNLIDVCDVSTFIRCYEVVE